jgi:hypothetical protein
MTMQAYANMTQASILVDYIRSHGIEAHEMNGHIFAHNWSVDDGQRYLQIVELEATADAVNEWLGY